MENLTTQTGKVGLEVLGSKYVTTINEEGTPWGIYINENFVYVIDMRTGISLLSLVGVIIKETFYCYKYVANLDQLIANFLNITCSPSNSLIDDLLDNAPKHLNDLP
jgi:hypothetical protein